MYRIFYNCYYFIKIYICKNFQWLKMSPFIYYAFMINLGVFSDDKLQLD